MTKQHFNCNTCEATYCLLKLLPRDELKNIEHNSASVKIRKGEKLFRQQTPVSYIYHIRSGIVKTFVESNRSRNFIINIHKAGHLLGIRSKLTSRSHQFSAEAIDDSVICYINPDVFVDILQRNNTFNFEILKLISKESLTLSEKLHSFMKLLLPGKIANILLYLSDEIYNSSTFDFPFTKTEFSQIIGASRERVSKTLSEFINDRIISLEEQKVTIESKELLVQLSKLG